MKINKGVFYTHHKTLTQFNAHHALGLPVKQLGSVAEVMAARIFLGPGGSVEVFINGGAAPVDTLQPTAGVSFQLDVLNLCLPDLTGCEYRPGHPTDPKKRNDFFTYYNAIDKEEDQRFHLMAVHPILQSNITGICRVADEHGTDPAPCGPTGYGGSGGFGGP